MSRCRVALMLPLPEPALRRRNLVFVYVLGDLQ